MVQTRIWEVEGQHLLTCQLLWSWIVAVESDCCCGVGLVELDCCCGVGLLLWSWIVEAQTLPPVGQVKAGAEDVWEAASACFFCLLRLSSLALEADGTV